MSNENSPTEDEVQAEEEVLNEPILEYPTDAEQENFGDVLDAERGEEVE